MFDHVGKKIKGIATVVTWIGIVISFIIGCILIYEGAQDSDNGILILIGILVMAIGSFIAWLSTILLYGFGELIDNSEKILLRLESGGNTAKNRTKKDEAVNLKPVEDAEEYKTTAADFIEEIKRYDTPTLKNMLENLRGSFTGQEVIIIKTELRSRGEDIK